MSICAYIKHEKRQKETAGRGISTNWDCWGGRGWKGYEKKPWNTDTFEPVLGVLWHIFLDEVIEQLITNGRKSIDEALAFVRHRWVSCGRGRGGRKGRLLSFQMGNKGDDGVLQKTEEFIPRLRAIVCFTLSSHSTCPSDDRHPTSGNSQPPQRSPSLAPLVTIHLKCYCLISPPFAKSYLPISPSCLESKHG